MLLLAYLRVSTNEQAEDGHSLDVQAARVRAYCEAHGHTLAGIFADEGVSASIPLARRPAGRALLAALKEGQGEGVVIIRLDRLFRSALDGLHFFHVLAARQQFTVHSVSELIDTGTPAGKLQLTLTLAAAEYERDLAVQRATDSSQGLRRAGKVFGHVPFGCIAHDGHLYRHPENWNARERIVALQAQGYSLATIKRLMHDEGIASPTGEPWWAKSSLAAICSTHDSLAHLPELPAQLAEVSASTPDTEVSAHGTRH